MKDPVHREDFAKRFGALEWRDLWKERNKSDRVRDRQGQCKTTRNKHELKGGPRRTSCKRQTSKGEQGAEIHIQTLRG